MAHDFLQERNVHARKGNRARFKWNAREKIVCGRASERKKENGGRRDRADPIDARDDGQEANLGRWIREKQVGQENEWLGWCRASLRLLPTRMTKPDARYLRVNGECVHAPPPPLFYAFSLLLLLFLPSLKLGSSFGTAARSSTLLSLCIYLPRGSRRKVLSLSLISIDVADTLPAGVHRRCGYVEIEHELGLTDISRASPLLIGPPRSRLEFAANRGLPFRMVPVGCADRSETWWVSWVR